MSFNLQNVGATYQSVMKIIFHDFLHTHVECLADDLAVKAKGREKHPHDLRNVCKKLCKCQLDMNPLKCAFGVTWGKFPRLVAWKEGITISLDKVKVIIQMPHLRNLRGL